jgi:hypothetical protein
VRPSRRPLRGPLRMRYFLDGTWQEEQSSS